MKNIISAAIIATVALAGAASADVTKLGVVFKDGKVYSSIYDSKIAEGLSDAEARMFVTDFYANQKAEAKKSRDQEVRAKSKATPAAPIVDLDDENETEVPTTDPVEEVTDPVEETTDPVEETTDPVDPVEETTDPVEETTDPEVPNLDDLDESEVPV